MKSTAFDSTNSTIALEYTTNCAFERGRQWGAFYANEGRDYGKPYPSNPYHPSDPQHQEYAAGYEKGFAE